MPEPAAGGPQQAVYAYGFVDARRIPAGATGDDRLRPCSIVRLGSIGAVTRTISLDDF